MAASSVLPKMMLKEVNSLQPLELRATYQFVYVTRGLVKLSMLLCLHEKWNKDISC